jgi:vacuolar-type H+-ATPase subunit I/STV1
MVDNSNTELTPTQLLDKIGWRIVALEDADHELSENEAAELEELYEERDRLEAAYPEA